MRLTAAEYRALRHSQNRATLTTEASISKLPGVRAAERCVASEGNVARSRGYGKYGAKPVEIDGFWFASSAEGRRYGQLRLLQAVGEISGLKLQPRFPFEIGEELMFTYIADFEYSDRQTGRRIIEDVKGVSTPVYKLKKKIIEKVFGITIEEIRGDNRRDKVNAKKVRGKTNRKG